MLYSLDVRVSADPKNLAYHEANRKAGRYIGEIGLQCEFQGRRGAHYHWLHVDPDTLADHAARAGWNCQVVMSKPDRLIRWLTLPSARKSAILRIWS